MSAPFNLDDSLKPARSWHHYAGYSHLLPKDSIVPVAHVAHPSSTSAFYMGWLVQPLLITTPAGPRFGLLSETLEEACRLAEEAYERTLQP